MAALGVWGCGDDVTGSAGTGKHALDASAPRNASTMQQAVWWSRPLSGAAADDETGAAVDPDAGLAQARTTCDVTCASADDCEAGQSCLDFKDGRKCAPDECADCPLGCIFELSTCTFARCSAPTTPGDFPQCGQLCEHDTDCPPDTVCTDVFGLGECAPPECTSCTGWCDYAPDGCNYRDCYVAVGQPTAVPGWLYCAHLY